MIKLKRSRDIFKALGFGSATEMHEFLKTQGVLHMVRNRWQLTRQYVGCDLCSMKYIRGAGWRLLWTIEGVRMIKDMVDGQIRIEVKRIAV